MKYIRKFLFLSVIFSLFGCDTTISILTVSDQNIEIPALGGSTNFNIQTDADSWSIEQPADWITLSANTGTDKEATVSIRVNTKTLTPRKDTLTIKAGNAAPVHLIVSQAANNSLYELTTNRAYFNFSNLPGTLAITISTDAPVWNAACAADWVQISQTTGTSGTKTFNITVARNSLSDDRTAELVVSAQDAPTLKVPIYQKAAFPNYNTSPISPDASGMGSTAVQIASKIKIGWNFGNTMEAIGGETAWGNPMINDAQIKLVKQYGFTAIRIPCSWNQYADQTTAKISDSWLNRVKEVVQLCTNNDMYVILNIHWDGGWLETNCTTAKRDENNAKQKAYWQQIATKLRDFDEHLMFASANEPNVSTATEMSVLLSYHQTFIDAVRSTGGKNAYRVLVIQGPMTDITTTNNLMNQLPTDNVSDKMMVEIHYYTPYNFTGMTEDQTWGKMWYFWGKDYHSLTNPTRNSTSYEEDAVVSYFGMMKRKFVDKGIPVVMGEYGASRRDNLSGEDLTLHLASRAYYIKYCTKMANSFGMLPFFWDCGGVFDRRQNTVIDQQTLNGILEGAGLK
jgi:endoglucanase